MHALENRVPPPLVTLLFALLMWLVARYVPGVELSHSTRVIVAALVVAVGLGFVLAGMLSFRKAQTTVNPLKPETTSALVTSGIYHYSRNPMYLGFALFLLAWACYLASPAALLGPVGFIAYMSRLQIQPEERALTALFGGKFQAYQERVRRWL